MKNWETFQAAYQAADKIIKDQLNSSLIPECVAEQVKKHQLDSSHQRTLVRLLSEKVLGLHNQPEVIEAMKQAGIPTSSIIYTDLINCMEAKTPSVLDTSLASTEDATLEVKPIQLSAANTPLAPDQTKSYNSLDSEIEEAEAAFAAIPKIKTMAQDAQHATMYSSNQDTLLRKKD